MNSGNSKQIIHKEPAIDETALADEEDPHNIVIDGPSSGQPTAATVAAATVGKRIIIRAPNKKWKWIILLVATVVVVATAAALVAGITVGVGHKNNGNKESSSQSSPVSTSEGDDSQKNEPTTTTTTNEPPPEASTQEPPVANTEEEEGPTAEEVTTEEPIPDDEGNEVDTSSPTNDMCANAIEVTLTDTTESTAATITGTTLSSTSEETVLDPGTSFCNWPWLPGVWYKMKGRGAGIRISACDDADINRSLDLFVYKGDNDDNNCGSLNCFENYSRGCSDTYGQSMLAWFGEVDQTYYMYVAEAGYAQGPFSLQVTEFDPPANNVCAGATALTVGEVSTVSTQNATADFTNNGMSNEYYDLLPGVYYTVVGTGTFLKATVPCLHMEQTRVYVYQGGCENRQMVGYSQTCQPDSFAYWNSVEDEVYHVLYQSSSEEPNVLTIIPFEAPENNLCADAIALTFSDSVATIIGTTHQATFEDLGYSRFDWNDNGTESFGFDGYEMVDQARAICDYRHTPGIWYTVQGRGTSIRVSTCDQSNSTAILSVYQGKDCASLNCVVNYPTRCGDQNQQNTLTWFGEIDQTYYIYVATTDDVTTQGSFTLQVTQFETPVNDFCPGAEQMTIGETSTVLMEGATAEFIGNGLFNDWDGNVLPGVFYNVNGTGAVMKAAAPCKDNARVRVFVYQGDCDEKVIVGEKVVCEPDSAAYWESVEGQVYHILIQSDSNEPIDLTVTEERPDLNDLCTGAAGPVPVGSVVEGDTSVARWSQYDRRRLHERDLLSVAPPGLFYTVIGTGNALQVTASCTEEFGEPSVFIDLFAVACQYDQREYVTVTRSSWCDPDYSLTWQSIEGELYFMHVVPGMYPGPFQFTVIEATP